MSLCIYFKTRTKYAQLCYSEQLRRWKHKNVALLAQNMLTRSESGLAALCPNLLHCPLAQKYCLMCYFVLTLNLKALLQNSGQEVQANYELY